MCGVSFFFWFWLLGSECLFLKFFVYPIAKMLMKLLLFSLGWGWFTCLAVGPHVGAWLFCKVLTFLLPSVLYISELCWNSRIWPLVLNSLVSCDFMFNFTCIMLQSRCEHVALLFSDFGCWLLSVLTEDVSLITAKKMLKLLFSLGSVHMPLTESSCFVRSCPVFSGLCPTHLSIYKKMCGLPRSHPTQKCDIIYAICTDL